MEKLKKVYVICKKKHDNFFTNTQFFYCTKRENQRPARIEEGGVDVLAICQLRIYKIAVPPSVLRVLRGGASDGKDGRFSFGRIILKLNDAVLKVRKLWKYCLIRQHGDWESEGWGKVDN